MSSVFSRLGKLAALTTFVAASACSSDDGDGSGSSNTGGIGGSGGSPGSNDNCGLDITLSGDVTFDLPIDRGITCLTAYTTAPGAYVGFGPAPVEDIALVALRFPELDPGQTAASLDIPMTIHHADRTQFSPMGCVVDVHGKLASRTDRGRRRLPGRRRRNLFGGGNDRRPLHQRGRIIPFLRADPLARLSSNGPKRGAVLPKTEALM